MSVGGIAAALNRWLRAWDEHDLEAVIELFHPRAVFDTWSGLRITGRERIRAAWSDWFEAGGFRFEREALVIDEASQTAVFAWSYEGPPLERVAGGVGGTGNGGGGAAVDRDGTGGTGGGLVGKDRSGWRDTRELRRGIDLLRFRDGAIIEKSTYSKTVFERGGERVVLRP